MAAKATTPDATLAMSDELVEQLAGEPADGYTVGEKIASILGVLFDPATARQADGRVAQILSLLPVARRMGMTQPIAGLFPPLESEAEWHIMLEVIVGCAIVLVSDGYQLDLERAQQMGLALMESISNLPDPTTGE